MNAPVFVVVKCGSDAIEITLNALRRDGLSVVSVIVSAWQTSAPRQVSGALYPGCSTATEYTVVAERP